MLSSWAKTLTLPSNKTTFFNFLASHDGIGLNPARGILSTADIDVLVENTLEHGGLVSYKHNSDGSQSPYEMNISYFDALSNFSRLNWTLNGPTGAIIANRSFTSSDAQSIGDPTVLLPAGSAVST